MHAANLYNNGVVRLVHTWRLDNPVAEYLTDIRILRKAARQDEQP